MTESIANVHHSILRLAATMVIVAPLSFSASALGRRDHGRDSAHIGAAEAPRPLFVIIDGPIKPAELHADGQIIKTEWQSVWRPICNSDASALTAEQLRAIADAHRQAFSAGAPSGHRLIDSGGVAGGFNIVFDLDGSVPGAADAAFSAAEAYLEGLFNDGVTVTINIIFDALPVGVLGGTGSEYTNISWNSSRNALESDMDSSDNIQDYLPSGSKIPVRYNGNSDSIINENRVFWTLANFRAAVGSVSGSAGDIVFNSDFNWDYEPANGVMGYSFQDVLVHETGHVLGFSSGADYRTKDMDALDIFRFQRSGGAHDYNPDTYSEFKVRPRLVDYNKPNDDHICDVISHEHRMSDGSPYQASHFREQGDNIGLMDPAISGGETFYNTFFSSADLRMFDAIGYDR
jgi:hypothetical protein